MKLLACLLLLLSACQVADVSQDTHFLVSDELRKIMQRMALLVHERQLTYQEIEDLRIHQAVAISEATDRLVAVTDSLAVNGSLSVVEINEFTGMSRRLRDEARLLKNMSRHGTAEELKEVFRRMESLCTGCHERFVSQ